jgi:hypothetical protein
MTRLPRPLTVSFLLLVLTVPGVALALPTTSSGGGHEPGGPWVTTRAGTTQWVFSTRDRRFLPHTSNQGWWSNTHDASNDNDNYSVGRCCGGGEFRNFFTFHLTGLTGSVISATLVLQKYDGRGGYEKYRLSDVTTSALKLNRNIGTNRAIFRDLGRGTGYGTYRLPTADGTRDDPVFELRLNANARAAIHRSAGAFFSLGGKILTLRDGGLLFSHSGGRGRQELIVTTSP